jgi:hypothetical protein
VLELEIWRPLAMSAHLSFDDGFLRRSRFGIYRRVLQNMAPGDNDRSKKLHY